MAAPSINAVRRFLAWAMFFALINVIGVCPVLARRMSPAHSCCRTSKAPAIPCTEQTARNCPYVLLEKAKWETAVIAFALAVVAVRGAELAPQRWFPSRIEPAYLADYSGSFLLLRTLRL